MSVRWELATGWSSVSVSIRRQNEEMRGILLSFDMVHNPLPVFEKMLGSAVSKRYWYRQPSIVSRPRKVCFVRVGVAFVSLTTFSISCSVGYLVFRTTAAERTGAVVGRLFLLSAAHSLVATLSDYSYIQPYPIFHPIYNFVLTCVGLSVGVCRITSATPPPRHDKWMRASRSRAELACLTFS